MISQIRIRRSPEGNTFRLEDGEIREISDEKVQFIKEAVAKLRQRFAGDAIVLQHEAGAEQIWIVIQTLGDPEDFIGLHEYWTTDVWHNPDVAVTVDFMKELVCDPPEACATHGECNNHTCWDDDSPAPVIKENKARFFARLEPCLAPSDVTRIRAAYYLAKFGHRFQVRKEPDENGEPLRYFEHVRRVALILMDEAKVMDPDLIITALLHDVLEDTQDIDGPMIELMFGREVARRVRLLSKLPKEGYLERLSAADFGTVLVKMCDRLDNLRSLESTENPVFIAKQRLETVNKYLPMFRSHVDGHKRGPGVSKVISQIETLTCE